MADNKDNQFDFEEDFAHANAQNCNDDNDYASQGVSFNRSAPQDNSQAHLQARNLTDHTRDTDANAYGDGDSASNGAYCAPSSRGSLFTGLIGAIVGALLGAIAWVMCRPYGSIAYFTPILIGVLTFVGYSAMCSRKSAVGAMLCTLVSIAGLLGGFVTSVVIMLTAIFSQFGMVWTDILMDLPLILGIPEIRNPLLIELAVSMAVLAATLVGLGIFSGIRAKREVASRRLSMGNSRAEYDEMPLHDFERDAYGADNKFN